MSSPASTELREEIETALAPMLRKLEVLDDLRKISISAANVAAVTDRRNQLARRRQKLLDVLVALDALEHDGFPEFDQAELPASQMQELQEQAADIELAVAEFTAVSVASNIDVDVGEPEDKAE